MLEVDYSFMDSSPFNLELDQLFPSQGSSESSPLADYSLSVGERSRELLELTPPLPLVRSSSPVLHSYSPMTTSSSLSSSPSPSPSRSPSPSPSPALPPSLVLPPIVTREVVTREVVTTREVIPHEPSPTVPPTKKPSSATTNNSSTTSATGESSQTAAQSQSRGSPRKSPPKPRAGRTPMSEFPIGTEVVVRPAAYHSPKVRAKLKGYFGKTVVISRLPIYPDTWFGIMLAEKQVKVRSSAFYRPEKEGVLPETPIVLPAEAAPRPKKRRRSEPTDLNPPHSSKSFLLNNSEMTAPVPEHPSLYHVYQNGVLTCVCHSKHTSKRIFNRHQLQCSAWKTFVYKHNLPYKLAIDGPNANPPMDEPSYSSSDEDLDDAMIDCLGDTHIGTHSDQLDAYEVAMSLSDVSSSPPSSPSCGAQTSLLFGAEDDSIFASDSFGRPASPSPPYLISNIFKDENPESFETNIVSESSLPSLFPSVSSSRPLPSPKLHHIELNQPDQPFSVLSRYLRDAPSRSLKPLPIPKRVLPGMRSNLNRPVPKARLNPSFNFLPNFSTPLSQFLSAKPMASRMSMPPPPPPLFLSCPEASYSGYF